MPKKAEPEFWEKRDNKWFAYFGPIELCVAEPIEIGDQEVISFARFLSHHSFKVGNDVEAAKAEAINLAEQLILEAKEVVDKLQDTNSKEQK